MNNFTIGGKITDGNFFPVRNGVFLVGLCSGELAVYIYLVRCADRTTHQCWPSYENIGKNVHQSRNTVRKHVRSLEEKRLIYTEHTTVTLQDGTKHNGTLMYTIRPFEDAWEYYVDKQQEENDRRALEERQKAESAPVAPV